ncbi:TetR/AcrR family transcriptional regulator, partial [Burkholderia multivorans]
MRSTSPQKEPGRSPNSSPETAQRILVAAVREFAAHGFAKTTVRAIAAAAGVSPGLVIHHFGSKEGLRTACDDHVFALITEKKAE